MGACTVTLGVYVYSLETVPFTNRMHSVLVTSKFENSLGSAMFEEVCKVCALGGGLFVC